MRIKCVLLLISLFSSVAIAEVPVVDVTQPQSGQQALVQSNVGNASSQSSAVDTTNMSVEQRLQRLEQIITAQGQMQLVQRLNQLQETVEILQGQNEVLRHQLQQLQTEQSNLVSTLASGKSVKKMPVTIGAANSSASGEQQVYQAAYNLIIAKQYNSAIKAFDNFVKQYPKSTYVPNALYWKGEVLAAQGDNGKAKATLQQLISTFPNDAKVPDATLKLAMILMNEKQADQAKILLNSIVKNYPNTATASIATNKLRELKG